MSPIDLNKSFEKSNNKFLATTTHGPFLELLHRNETDYLMLRKTSFYLSTFLDDYEEQEYLMHEQLSSWLTYFGEVNGRGYLLSEDWDGENEYNYDEYLREEEDEHTAWLEEDVEDEFEEEDDEFAHIFLTTDYDWEISDEDEEDVNDANFFIYYNDRDFEVNSELTHVIADELDEHIEDDLFSTDFETDVDVRALGNRYVRSGAYNSADWVEIDHESDLRFTSMREKFFANLEDSEEAEFFGSVFSEYKQTEIYDLILKRYRNNNYFVLALKRVFFYNEFYELFTFMASELYCLLSLFFSKYKILVNYKVYSYVNILFNANFIRFQQLRISIYKYFYKKNNFFFFNFICIYIFINLYILYNFFYYKI